LQEALLVAYIMVLEDDALNYGHLLDASLPALLDKYIAERLYRGHNLWPIEDTCNALAVALFWHMTSQGAWTIALHLPPSVNLTLFLRQALSTASQMIAATRSWTSSSPSHSPGSGSVPSFYLFTSSLLPNRSSLHPAVLLRRARP
jgi:hypothetical protein